MKSSSHGLRWKIGKEDMEVDADASISIKVLCAEKGVGKIALGFRAYQ